MQDPRASKSEHDHSPGLSAWLFRLFLIAVLVGLAVFGWASLSLRGRQLDRQSAEIATLAGLATQNESGGEIAPPETALPSTTSSPMPTQVGPLGTVFYAAYAGAHRHLWAVSPGKGSPVLLTDGDFDDQDPAASPDGRWLAFASNRGGTWDLYLLDLATGDVRPLTQTPGFDGHPSWSPDGKWIAYEAYGQLNFDIWILSVDGSQPPIQLTNQPSKDISPSWDPGTGRRIAFVSDRDGSDDIFIADLSQPQDRFHNWTQSPAQSEADPAFSPDGASLLFSVNVDGQALVKRLDLEHPDRPAVELAEGQSPAWSPDGTMMVANWPSSQGEQLVAYDAAGGDLMPLTLNQIAIGDQISWSAGGLSPSWLPAGKTSEDSRARLPETTTPGQAMGKLSLIDLRGVTAPNATLVGSANEAFQSLRKAAAEEIGWDFLGRLDDAFVGLNDPLPPGFAFNDWLYTGRAFRVTDSALTGGWMVAVREDYAGQTYWRLFVRANQQDGSQGQPLRVRPWDFEARADGDPSHYNQGGAQVEAMPAGYFVDFTSLAAAYGFERQPALSNWRSFYPSARYDEFAFTEGLDWLTAMLQLYPPSALATPTRYSSPTITPTNTPTVTPTSWWWRWLLPSATPSPTLTPSSTAPPP